MKSFFTILVIHIFFIAKPQSNTVAVIKNSSTKSDTLIRDYKLELGSMPNNESGAIFSYNLSRLLLDQTNRLVKNSNLNTIAGRATNALVIQFFIGKELYGVFPHEFFGHYTKGLEFGMDVRSVHLRFPGIGGYTNAVINHRMSAINRMMYAGAGSEVQSTISFLAEKDLYKDEYVSTYQAAPIFFNKIFTYLYYQEDLNSFVRSPDQFVRDNLKGGDFTSYSFSLAESYGFYKNLIDPDATWFDFPADPNLLNIDFIKDQNKRMNRAYLLSLIDFGILEFFIGNYQYIAKGKSFYKPFIFSINKLKFMPSIRANMGELGAENYFDLILNHPSFHQANLYYREGGNAIHEMRGFGFGMRNVRLSKKIILSPQLDFWSNERNNTSNFNVYTDVTLFLTDKFYLFQSLGYKSYGGLIGKPLNEGLYGYVGLGVKARL
jgi:hypothetical protein